MGLAACHTPPLARRLAVQSPVAQSPAARPLKQELTVQSKLAFPLAVGLIANYALSIISLSMVGQLGTQEMAAAALGSTLYSMSAKLLLMGCT